MCLHQGINAYCSHTGKFVRMEPPPQYAFDIHEMSTGYAHVAIAFQSYPVDTCTYSTYIHVEVECDTFISLTTAR